MKKLTIYTDGACSGNPGPGGWAAVLQFGPHKKEISGCEPETTNNRMELMAAIQALSTLKEPCIVALYTDSAYLCRAFHENWLTNWQHNGWKTAQKSPVENKDLWEQLIQLSSIHDVTWNKVKGHSDNEWNNRCDVLARKAIQAIDSRKNQ